MQNMRLSNLWLRWVTANSLGEMLGLGATFAVLAAGLAAIDELSTVCSFLLGYGLAIISGILEASIVGWAQWKAMKPWLPNISLRSWWLATLIGALIAYSLGYLPSTIMSLQEQSAQTAAVEPEQWVVLLLAAGMGLAGGLILSIFQGRELRRHISGAWKWVPANMIAWMLGMPLIFWGIDQVQKVSGTILQVLLMAVILLLTGAVVGVVHGLVLIHLVKKSVQDNKLESVD